jgi:DNA polymerase elongation subunit (family B)
MQKLLFLDIENSPKLIYAWDLYETNALKVEKQSEIMSFAWKWQGDKNVKVISLRQYKPKELLKKIHGILDEADIVCGHNSKSFDVKMLNAFFIHYGLPPTRPFKQIDTLQIARRHFKFASNKLNDLGEYLGVGKKVPTGGIDLWFKCMAGDKKALFLMEKYNKQDVNLLEMVYEKLIPWAENQPPVYHGLFCKKCGGEVQFRGPYENKQFIGKRYQCKRCFSWGVSNKQYKVNKEEYVK